MTEVLYMEVTVFSLSPDDKIYIFWGGWHLKECFNLDRLHTAFSRYQAQTQNLDAATSWFLVIQIERDGANKAIICNRKQIFFVVAIMCSTSQERR